MVCTSHKVRALILDSISPRPSTSLIASPAVSAMKLFVLLLHPLCAWWHHCRTATVTSCCDHTETWLIFSAEIEPTWLLYLPKCLAYVIIFPSAVTICIQFFFFVLLYRFAWAHQSILWLKQFLCLSVINSFNHSPLRLNCCRTERV